MKLAKIIIMFLIVLALAATTLAYPVDVTLNGNVPFTTNIYTCIDSSCNQINTPSAISTSSSNSINLYSLGYLHSGNQYYAEYDYAACQVPHSYLITTDSTTQSAQFDIQFTKQADCSASVIASLPDAVQAVVNDTIRVQATVDSIRVLDPNGPQNVPQELQDIYAQNVTVFLYDNNALYDTKVVRINSGSSQEVYFNYTATIAGTHNLQIRTTAQDECTCDSSITSADTTVLNVVENHIVLNSIGNFTIYTNQALTFLVNASDAYNHPLTYSYTKLPTGASVNYQSGIYQFAWTPNQSQAGTYNITFTARDATAYGNYASETVFIQVLSNTSNTTIPMNNTNTTIPANTTNTTIPTNITNTTIGQCTDSDGGLAYSTQGSVILSQTSSQSTSQTIFTDFCVDNTRVYEGYCDLNGTVKQTIYSCQFGCLNGACLTTNPAGNLTVSTNQTQPEQILAETSLILVKSIRMFSLDMAGYVEETGVQNGKMYAYVTLQNAGTIDQSDVVISFSIPEMGIDTKETIKTFKAGTSISKKLEIDLPGQEGVFEAKISVSTEKLKTTKYRIIRVI